MLSVSEADFIAAFKNLQSPTLVAKHFGYSSIRQVQDRKKRIEDRLGILLPVSDKRPAYNTASIDHSHNAMATFSIADGHIIIGGDAHYWPGEAPTMHRAYVELCKRLKPKAVVMNGDAFDGASISRFPSIGWEKKPGVKDELEVVQTRLGEIQKAAIGAKRFWTAGNHDLRFESRLAAVAPEYKDVKGIHLKDHFPEWIPCWFLSVNNDQVEIRHREKGGVHAAYNNTKEAGISIVTGHDHRADVVAYNDRTGRRYGVRHGMMAESPMDGQFVHYLEGRRINWQSSLAVLTFRGGLMLQPELCLQVKPGLAEFRGELLSV